MQSTIPTHGNTGQHPEENNGENHPELRGLLEAVVRDDISALLINDLTRISRTEGIRAAIYIRVAIDDNQSAQRQESTCRNYASGRGYDVIRVYSDVGRSGNEDRPNLTELVKAADRHEFDILLTTDPARIARTIESSMNINTALIRSEIRIEFAARQ